jgi:peptide chain release factor 2
MITDRTYDIAASRERVTRIGAYLHLDAKRTEADALEAKAAEPGFWDDPATAQATMSRAAEIRGEIAEYESLTADIDEAEVANELAVGGDDEDLAAEVTAARSSSCAAASTSSSSRRGSRESSTTATRSSQ